MARLSSCKRGQPHDLESRRGQDRLSEVVNLALTEGPQVITRRSDTVVVLSADKYAELTGQKPTSKSSFSRAWDWMSSI